MTSVNSSAPELAAAGWAALASGDWDEAFTSFSAAVETGDDAEAYEGLAWAAWWRNDAATLFRSREQAYHRFRSGGDAMGAARAAIWLGCDYHDFRGEHAVGAGWHRRARRHLEGLPPCREQGWLAFQEGGFALELTDDTTTARERAAEVAVLARTLGDSDLEFLALALEGLALVTEGAVADGMAHLDEASLAITTGEFRERVAATWTLCYLMYACERVRDLDRTAQWCRRFEELSTKFAFDLGIGVCRAHYGGVLVLSGDWERAEKELAEARRVLTLVRPPAACEALARLGELRRRQGRPTEAATLFDQSGPHPLAVLGRAGLATDQGDPALAIELLEDLLSVTPPNSATQRVDALALLVRARVANGDLDAAEQSAAYVEEIGSAVGTPALKAMATWARGVVAGARGEPDQARRLLDQSAELFERAGLPYEAAWARMELARTLHAAGRASAARTQADRATQQLLELGSDLTTHPGWSDPAVPLAGRDAAGGPAVDGAGAARDGAANGVVDQLTPREREVLSLLGLALSDREIADRLVISPHTVHRHVSNILTKLALRSRSAAAAFATRHGLTAPEPPA